MISCNLCGGIGNQLFQIAATHALCLRNNDICGFDFKACNTQAQGFKAIKYKDTVFSDVPQLSNYNWQNYYIEKKFSYDKIEYKKDLLLTGYFQSEKYFEDYKQEIINLFNLSRVEEIKHMINSIKIRGNLQTTAIHVRRGDYLKHQNYHPICGIEYYNKAMDIIGDSHFTIVSDDISWCKENFINRNIIFSDFNDEIMDLTVLAASDNIIISNSSFSWWGSYLNRNENKKIIAPSSWFGEMGPQDTQDIYLKDWIVI